MIYEYLYVDRSSIIPLTPSENFHYNSSTSDSGYGLLRSRTFISCAVNALYVYVVLTQSITVQIIATILTIVYKLGWVYLIIIPWLESVPGKFARISVFVSTYVGYHGR